MKQIARNLTDCEDGFLNGKRFLIMDRDTKFTDGFREILEGEGVEAVRLPPRSPNLNPHIESFVRSIKDESLLRMILFGENMLRNAVRQFLAHYHTERNHQSLDSKIIQPGDEVGRPEVTSNVANVSAACCGTTIARQRSSQTVQVSYVWLVVCPSGRILLHPARSPQS